MKSPKILVYDIETSHALAAIFSLFQDSVPHKNILQEWYIISIAYKWLGAKQTKAVSVLDDIERFKKNPNDDYHVLKTIREVIAEADAIIHHYGDNFDIKKFNTRLLYHGLDPLPPIIQIDTYKICKSKFKFMSNSLDYIGNYLGVGQKINTTPGLWLRCLQGVKSAIREMVGYNKQDVNLLEAVYLKIAPFAPAHLNLNHFYGSDFERVCPRCGGTSLQSRGLRYTKTTKFRRFQCNSCRGWASAPQKQNGELGALR